MACFVQQRRKWGKEAGPKPHLAALGGWRRAGSASPAEQASAGRPHLLRVNSSEFGGGHTQKKKKVRGWWPSTRVPPNPDDRWACFWGAPRFVVYVKAKELNQVGARPAFSATMTSICNPFYIPTGGALESLARVRNILQPGKVHALVSLLFLEGNDFYGIPLGSR